MTVHMTESTFEGLARCMREIKVLLNGDRYQESQAAIAAQVSGIESLLFRASSDSQIVLKQSNRKLPRNHSEFLENDRIIADFDHIQRFGTVVFTGGDQSYVRLDGELRSMLLPNTLLSIAEQ